MIIIHQTDINDGGFDVLYGSSISQSLSAISAITTGIVGLVMSLKRSSLTFIPKRSLLIFKKVDR